MPEVDENDVQDKIEEGKKWKNDVIKKKGAEKKKHDEHLQEKLEAKNKGQVRAGRHYNHSSSVKHSLWYNALPVATHQINLKIEWN